MNSGNSRRKPVKEEKMKGLKIWIPVLLLIASISLAGCQESKSAIEDVKWVLTSYGEQGNEQSPLPDTTVTAFFDSEKVELTGNASCNTYYASYEIDGSKLSIPRNFAVTEMWCGDEKGEQERKFLEILPNAESFEVTGGKLTIDCGNKVLNFEKD